MFQVRSGLIISVLLAVVCFTTAVPPVFSLSDQPNFVLFLTDDQTLYSFSRMIYLSSRPYGDWIDLKTHSSAPPSVVHLARLF
jgi:hypothetical protein